MLRRTQWKKQLCLFSSATRSLTCIKVIPPVTSLTSCMFCIHQSTASSAMKQLSGRPVCIGSMDSPVLWCRKITDITLSLLNTKMVSNNFTCKWTMQNWKKKLHEQLYNCSRYKKTISFIGICTSFSKGLTVGLSWPLWVLQMAWRLIMTQLLSGCKKVIVP